MPHPAERADSDDLIRGRTAVGDFELTILSDGWYLLDGGAMFGVVPKPLWEKRALADAENRILLGLNTVIVRTGKHTVAIETGIGNKLPPKLRDIYAAKERLPHAFAAAGIRPEEVDIVINSHLHFDHSGWNTTRTPEGRVVPTFPNARYFAHRGEVEHGHLQLERDAISYISDNYDPLVESGQMTLLDTRPGQTDPIIPGISVECFPGHTAQLLAIHIESAG
ncbi:MAG TPA: MBL fold metallo-hydrolase, partial [Acidobacteriaceae bacterium]|nr:MBL fold metallo-hydrolase [Acidobacteriaceae bacterium]